MVIVIARLRPSVITVIVPFPGIVDVSPRWFVFRQLEEREESA